MGCLLADPLEIQEGEREPSESLKDDLQEFFDALLCASVMSWLALVDWIYLLADRYIGDIVGRHFWPPNSRVVSH